MKVSVLFFSVFSIVSSQDSNTFKTPATLFCGDVETVERNSTLLWKYFGNDISSTTPNITITEPKEAGTYTCIYNGELKGTYTVGNFSVPKFVNARTSVTYNDGDHNRKLTCESESFPPPTFSWSRKGSSEGEAELEVTSATNPNYEITSNGTRSVLLFHNVTYQEAQTFICGVFNFAGNDTTEILVRVKSRYAAVWPFLGIVIEVVILIIIIFVYEKRSKKVSEDRPTFTPSEDEKPLNRDEGMEVRNRHGSK